MKKTIVKGAIKQAKNLQELMQSFYAPKKLADGTTIKNIHGAGKHKAANAAFTEAGRKQRNVPESTMVRLQNKRQTSGEYSWALEHIGDLSHRMNDPNVRNSQYIGEMAGKIRKSARDIIKDPVGSKKRMTAQAKRNEEYNVSQGKLPTTRADLKEIAVLKKKYSQSHATIPVYNKVGAASREAAVALGKRDFPTAAKNLNYIQKMTQSEIMYKKAAGKYTTDAKGRIIKNKIKGTK